MATVADFDALRGIKDGVAKKPWADPQVREAITLHFRMKRAKEEIHRLNVEIRRQTTYMRDEHVLYQHTVRRTQDSDPDLAIYIAKEGDYQDSIFTFITYYLIKTSKLLHFSGVLKPGTRSGAINEDVTEPPLWLRLLQEGDRRSMSDVTQDPQSGGEDDEGHLVVDLIEQLAMKD
jgi:hypothetical protein